MKDLTLQQSRLLATAYRINDFRNVEAKEDPAGVSREHMAWMLDRMLSEDMPIAKFSRWLGYVQAWLVLYHHKPLDFIKDETRHFRDKMG